MCRHCRYIGTAADDPDDPGAGCPEHSEPESIGTSAEDGDDPGYGEHSGRQSSNWARRMGRVLMASACLLLFDYILKSEQREYLILSASGFVFGCLLGSRPRCQIRKCRSDRSVNIPAIDRSNSQRQLSKAIVPASTKQDDQLDLDSLPSEVKGPRILEYLGFEQIFQMKSLSREWKSLIEGDGFLRSLSLKEKPSLTACYFFVENGILKLAGFDPNWRENSSKLEPSSSTRSSGKWRILPPFSFLPADCHPDADLFKQFLFCANAGLVCMNFSKSPHEERLIVFNPLSGDWKELPSLLHRRNPVLMYMLVDSSSKSYQVLVAGSSAAGDEALSKISELYDSRTRKWERVGDLPGPAFALNEYQAGVFHNGNILCIGFVDVNDQLAKGILEFNIARRQWSAKRTDPAMPRSPILQLVENCGEIFLYSERENGRATEHWVDKIKLWTHQKEEDEETTTTTTYQLINVVKKSKIGGRSLEVYPEVALVPYSEKKLCLYNTIDHTGEVYDIQSRDERCETLPALPQEGFRGELEFFTLNPITFTIDPTFSSTV